EPAPGRGRAQGRRRGLRRRVETALRADAPAVHGPGGRGVPELAAPHEQWQGGPPRAARPQRREGSAMNLTPTEPAIRQFLVEDVFYDRDLTSLGPEDSLLQKGLLDSMAILKTVTFCEEQFGITIPDQEVLPDHFESVRAIAKLVERVRGK